MAQTDRACDSPKGCRMALRSPSWATDNSESLSSDGRPSTRSDWATWRDRRRSVSGRWAAPGRSDRRRSCGASGGRLRSRRPLRELLQSRMTGTGSPASTPSPSSSERETGRRGHAREHVARLDARALAHVAAVLVAHHAPGRSAACRRRGAGTATRATAMHGFGQHVGVARDLAQRGTGEQLEADARRHRVARQPEHRHAADRPERERLGRLDRDLHPRVLARRPFRREPLEHDLHEVVVADRHPAAREQRVALVDRTRDRRR